LTHAQVLINSKEFKGGTWTSKLGRGDLIAHNRHDLSGSSNIINHKVYSEQYGEIVVSYTFGEKKNSREFVTQSAKKMDYNLTKINQCILEALNETKVEQISIAYEDWISKCNTSSMSTPSFCQKEYHNEFLNIVQYGHDVAAYAISRLILDDIFAIPLYEAVQTNQSYHLDSADNFNSFWLDEQKDILIQLWVDYECK
jgi:hypothetical protein